MSQQIHGAEGVVVYVVAYKFHVNTDAVRAALDEIKPLLT